MSDNDLLIIKAAEIASLLSGRELEVIQFVRLAYEAHRKGDSALPHSTFLRFPDNERNRIIALPAYLGGDFAVAGVKWVSSFPDNLASGLDRASAVVVLNSVSNGRPETILEGSIISAKRTAASAALAAQVLSQNEKVSELGLIGCGLINFEIARFTLAALPAITRFTVFDLDPARANQFAEKCRSEFREVQVTTAPDIETVLRNLPLISLATTAVKPHIADVSACRPGATLLHVSLRDLSPEAILRCDNIADDIDHVCRAQTSIHLAEQLVGDRDFVRCNLADILVGDAASRRDAESVAVFSPFGLGILDLAISTLVCRLARQRGLGTAIASFLPDSWVKR